MDWDEYEPESSREFDLCAACRGGADHTVEQHLELVEDGFKAEAEREDALYRYAKLVYDTDRL